jgi:uncharacterized lipoprotein YmbA
MMMRHPLTALTIFCLTAALLAGCSRSPRVTFYTLNATATSETTAADPTAVTVTVGPVSLPSLVDQPQLVVRTALNQVDILEMQRWAEPLKNEIPRIIAANLAVLLPQARVSFYPQNANLDADFRIQVDIQRLEMTAGQGVVLDALWSVRSAREGVPKTGRSMVNEPARGGDYDALVAAQSRALAVLSRDLAQAIRAVSASPR